MTNYFSSKGEARKSICRAFQRLVVCNLAGLRGVWAFSSTPPGTEQMADTRDELLGVQMIRSVISSARCRLGRLPTRTWWDFSHLAFKGKGCYHSCLVGKSAMSSFLLRSRLSVVSSLLPTLTLSGVHRQAPALWRRSRFPTRVSEGPFCPLTPEVLLDPSIGKPARQCGHLLPVPLTGHLTPNKCIFSFFWNVLGPGSLSCSQQKLALSLLPPPSAPPSPLYPHRPPPALLSSLPHFSSSRSLTEGLQRQPAPPLALQLHERTTFIAIKPCHVSLPSSRESSKCHRGFQACVLKSMHSWPYLALS